MTADSGLLRRIEKLIHRIQALQADAQSGDAKADFDYALSCLGALAGAVMQGRDVFGIEPWHVVDEKASLDAPGEMLLRLKDSRGEALAPYPAIMTFYRNNLTAEIDTVLVLCALDQFEASNERQASINISARSLRNPDFVKTVLERIERVERGERTIILEIHESTPHLTMNQKVLELFRKAGVLFAIDDVGLHLNDVFRLAEFDGIADFIKLDRQSVLTHPGNPNSLDHVISFVGSMLPNAVMVAEGVKSAEHALELRDYHPDIRYVQGLYLPGRAEFTAEWKRLAGV